MGICGHCRRAIASCIAEPCAARAFDNDAEARIDRYHAGYSAFRCGQRRPADADGSQGWVDARTASRSVPIMVRRPEGYYHMPLEAA